MSRFRRFLQAASARRFAEETRGTMSIEFTIWLPFFFIFFFLLTDVSVFFWQYSQMWDAAREASRAVSLGDLSATTQAVNAFVQDRLGANFSGSLSSGVTLDRTVEVSAAFADLTALATLDSLIDLDIVAAVQMRRELPL